MARDLDEPKSPSIRIPLAVSMLCSVIIITGAVEASSLKISLGSTSRTNAEVEADYTTSHVSLNETTHQTVPITFFFDPQQAGIESAELFTNLNRRDYATRVGPDGVEEGIKPPSGAGVSSGDATHYFRAYPMESVAGGFGLTLQVEKCGAYRVTVRYRRRGELAGAYRWYGEERNAGGIFKRDHAIVASPQKVHDIQLYEVNPLTIAAQGTAANERSTFADLIDGVSAHYGPQFSLEYLKQLGLNAIWLQPIHPRGQARRQIDPVTGRPFELGSPYSVKNYFAVMPLMTRGITPTGRQPEDDTPDGRNKALAEFRRFVNAADAKDIDVFLDAPFNHTAPDVELAEVGQRYWGNASSSPLSEIRGVQPRVYSRTDAYDMRAPTVHQIASATDRYDFSKFRDVADVYFGRYSALVPDKAHKDRYRSEEDRFDPSVGSENGRGPRHGHFDAVTQGVWRYFGDYIQFWLDQSGYPPNPAGDALESAAGIDGLRADFAQGLPPQAWEYIVNRTRSRKWNFIFMAESLDGGRVSYRSGRQFDLLNDNLIYAQHQAQTARDFRSLFDQRRAAYGGMPILLNTTSHDEDNYRDPFEAFIRYAVNNTIEGAPMIFPGQELGLRGTIVPPRDSAPRAGHPFGYQRFESGFAGKPIPHFKKYNSLMPLWSELARPESSASRLHALYASVGKARRSSLALRSANRTFLDLKDGSSHPQIFGIAKFERRNADPQTHDVVFAFINLAVRSDVGTSRGSGFTLGVDADHDGSNDFGIKAGHFYNLKNIAAFDGIDPRRHEKWVWAQPKSGRQLLADGLQIQLKRVPQGSAGWREVPFEPLFLKLFDVTESGHQ